MAMAADENLIRRARQLISHGLSDGDAAATLTSDRVTSVEDAYLAISAAKLLDKWATEKNQY